MNLKLNLKVLREMHEEFVRFENVVIPRVSDEQTKEKLKTEVNELKGHVKALYDHYSKALSFSGI